MRTIAMLFLVPVLAVAQEQSIPASKLPAEIRSAVAARFPGTPITGAAKETEDGKTFFEVTLKINGKNVDVTATQSGELTLIEREMKRSELPAAVSRLLDETYPKAKFQMVEDVSTVTNKGETLSYYEVLLVDAKKQTLEVQVAVDGSKILKEEKKKAGDPNE
jgi:hypothetical protein